MSQILSFREGPIAVGARQGEVDRENPEFGVAPVGIRNQVSPSRSQPRQLNLYPTEAPVDSVYNFESFLNCDALVYVVANLF